MCHKTWCKLVNVRRETEEQLSWWVNSIYQFFSSDIHGVNNNVCFQIKAARISHCGPHYPSFETGFILIIAYFLKLMRNASSSFKCRYFHQGQFHINVLKNVKGGLQMQLNGLKMVFASNSKTPYCVFQPHCYCSSGSITSFYIPACCLSLCTLTFVVRSATDITNSHINLLQLDVASCS